MKLVVSPAAIVDLDRLRTFLVGKNPVAARRAIDTILAKVQSLDRSPDRGQPIGSGGVREIIAPFGSSAYVIRYSHLPDSDEVLILRIWHGREQRD